MYRTNHGITRSNNPNTPDFQEVGLQGHSEDPYLGPNELAVVCAGVLIRRALLFAVHITHWDHRAQYHAQAYTPELQLILAGGCMVGGGIRLYKA